MKRILSMLLVAVLLLSTSSMTAFSADAGNLTVASVTGKPGQTVDVAVTMSNNPGLVGLMLKVQFDSALTLTKVTNGTVLPDTVMTPGGNLTANPYTMIWLDATARENYTTNGTLVTLTFTVASDAEPGEKNVTLEYSPDNTFDWDFKSVSFTVASGAVNVPAPKPTSVAVTTPPAKTEYFVGDAFDATGMVVTASFDDGSTKVLAADEYTCSPETFTAAGNQKVTVSYTAAGVTRTAYINVTVVKPELKSIAVDTEHVKTEYCVGEFFDPSGLEVTATYTNGTKQPVTDYTYSPKTAFAATGSQTVTVSFTDDGVTKTASFTVTVVKPVLESIEVTKMPTKTAYYVGDTFDKTGMVVTATYDNGTRKIVTGYTCSPETAFAAANENEEITVSYTEDGVTKTTSIAVTVLESELDSIAVTKNPSKMTYHVGETFDPAGMVVTATYTNGSKKILEQTDYTYEPTTEFTAAGNQKITVTYTEGDAEKTVSFNVKVIQLQSIEVTKQPTKAQYLVGETLDPTGMVVTATYSDSSRKTVTNYDYSPKAPFTKEGHQTITVTYTEDGVTETCTFTVTIIKKALDSIAVTAQADKVIYFIGDKFVPDGMVVTATYTDGSTKEIAADKYTYSPDTAFTKADKGTKKITVTYTEEGVTKTTEFSVTVIRKLTSVVVTKKPDKLSYAMGERLDTKGMVVTAKFNDDTSETVTDKVECTLNEDLSTPGTKTVIVTYEENEIKQSATFTVTVKKPVESTIQIHNYKKTRTVDYRATITFSADITNPVEGATVHWYVNGKEAGTGLKYTKTEAKETFIVQAVYKLGDEVLTQSDTEKVEVKTTFLAKVVAFIRWIFKKLPVIEQEFRGIEVY